MMLKLMNVQIVVFLVWATVSFIVAVPVKNDDGGLNFILLHNNDLHGRFDESTIRTTECAPEDALANKCFGGFARISTLVKRYRDEQYKENGKPVLFLNAGDTYVGTPWFYVFRDKIASDFMNLLKPDVGVCIYFQSSVFYFTFKRFRCVCVCVFSFRINMCKKCTVRHSYCEILN